MITSKKIFCTIFALILGALLTLAFAPFHLYILAFISPALLLLMWQNAKPNQAFCYGWFYGLGFFSTGVYWVYISIHTYGHASLLLAYGITSSLIMFLALFPAGQGYLWNKYGKKNILLFPVGWVLFEWLRSWVLTGFPWLFLGYSQLTTPLRGIAPIFGVYGVSFVVALTAAAVAIIIKDIAKKQFFFLKHYLLFVTAAIWIISVFLMHKNWTYPVGAPIQVSLIQGNVPQEAKWDSKQLPIILAKYEKLTKQHWDSYLIVWPEAAIPMFDWQAKDFINRITKEAVKHKSVVITGVPIGDRLHDKYYNGIVTLGKNKSIYLKRHLVPFGEYPFLGTITKVFMNMMQIPMSEFTPGARRQPDFMADNLIIAPTVCYEIAYPNAVLDFFPQAQLLLNISDDSWFGTSIAADQQLEMAKMRSLETGRYQLVAGNTGITAIINPDGTIQKQLPPFQQAVLTGTIRVMEGATPWVKITIFVIPAWMRGSS